MTPSSPPRFDAAQGKQSHKKNVETAARNEIAKTTVEMREPARSLPRKQRNQRDRTRSNTMTFEELNKKLGGNEKITNWKQHPNGLGWVHISATVETTAFIGADAIVWGKVYGNAQVSGDARVYGNAWVYGDARVYGDAWEKSPLFLIGSRDSLCNAKHGHLQIGCRCEKFRWWLGKEALKLAQENGYTPDEIKEYRAYVELFITVGK
jgi:hypothetical protein